MSDPVLEIRDLAISYPRNAAVGNKTRRPPLALQSLSLQLRRGEVLAVIGESGSGKTTLARAITGLVAPTAGELRFLGRPWNPARESPPLDFRRRLQLVFQDPHSAFNPRRSLRQALDEPLQLYFPGEHASHGHRIAEALRLVNLDGAVLQRFPHQLSGGQKQRLALARCLLAEPDLLVADEPFSALDTSEQARLAGVLLTLRQQTQLTICLVMHDLVLARLLADSVAVLHAGKLIEYGPAERVFSHPDHAHTKMLVQLASATERALGATGA